MADIVVTAVDVKITSNTVFKKVQFGETTTHGAGVYKKAADQLYWLAVNSSEAAADIKGIVLLPNVANGWGIIATSGDVDLGATLTIPQRIVVSSTAGNLHVDTDLATGEWVGETGTVKTAALLTMGLNSLGAQHP